MATTGITAAPGKPYERKSDLLHNMRRYWQLYVIILLPVSYIIIFKYIPIFGVIIAFKDYRVTKGILGSSWVGFKYFQMFFTSPSSMGIIINTLTLSLYGLAAGFPFPILLALSLNEIKARFFKKAVQMVTYAPHFISTVVMVGLIFQFLDLRSGMINVVLKLLGSEPVNFMGKPEYFRHIYVWSGILQSMGYGAVIYLAALSSINPELYEAAIIDGASKLKRVWYIDIPGILPTIIIILILNAGYIMNVGFEKVYLMQNQQNITTSEIISTFVYKIGLQSMNYSFSTAVGLFNSVVNLVLLATVNSIARRVGETSLW